MFLEIPDLLTGDELAALRRIGREAPFVDGRISNPHNQTKQNLQIDTGHASHREASGILAAALNRSEEVRRFAFPTRMAVPMLCKYVPGMAYGGHSDSAFLPMRPEPLRSDVSCTIFIADPDAYEGGELTAHLGNRSVTVKGVAGSAILYPSTTIHEVQPVRSGERLVAITFIQSQIVDEKQRELLWELGEVSELEGLTMKWENRIRLEHVRQTLYRLWSG